MTALVIAWIGLGAGALWLAWFWASTWPDWAWDDVRHPFLRYVWRRLSARRVPK
jgi:hypothetical protein